MFHPLLPLFFRLSPMLLLFFLPDILEKTGPGSSEHMRGYRSVKYIYISIRLLCLHLALRTNHTAAVWTSNNGTQPCRSSTRGYKTFRQKTERDSTDKSVQCLCVCACECVCVCVCACVWMCVCVGGGSDGWMDLMTIYCTNSKYKYVCLECYEGRNHCPVMIVRRED